MALAQHMSSLFCIWMMQRLSLNVQSVPDILKTLQNLFGSVLTDVTKGMQEEDLVQVILIGVVDIHGSIL
jgi:hypothetical protein